MNQESRWDFFFLFLFFTYFLLIIFIVNKLKILRTIYMNYDTSQSLSWFFWIYIQQGYLANNWDARHSWCHPYGLILLVFCPKKVWILHSHLFALFFCHCLLWPSWLLYYHPYPTPASNCYTIISFSFFFFLKRDFVLLGSYIGPKWESLPHGRLFLLCL